MKLQEEEIEDKIEESLSYSESEKIVGKWIDGKNIYERTITYYNSSKIGDSAKVTDIKIAHNIDNLDLIVNHELRCKGYLFPIVGSSGSSLTSLVSYDINNITLRIVKTDWGSRNWYITLKYTKNE